jgi:hypothetical protein
MPFDGHTDVRTQILLDTRSLLARRGGWCKGTLHENKNKRDSYCIYGALKTVARQHGVNLLLNPNGHTLVQSILLALGEPKCIDPGPIAKFNDVKSRRKHEVLNLLDRAIEYLPCVPQSAETNLLSEIYPLC